MVTLPAPLDPSGPGQCFMPSPNRQALLGANVERALKEHHEHLVQHLEFWLVRQEALLKTQTDSLYERLESKLCTDVSSKASDTMLVFNEQLIAAQAERLYELLHLKLVGSIDAGEDAERPSVAESISFEDSVAAKRISFEDEHKDADEGAESRSQDLHLAKASSEKSHGRRGNRSASDIKLSRQNSFSNHHHYEAAVQKSIRTSQHHSLKRQMQRKQVVPWHKRCIGKLQSLVAWKLFDWFFVILIIINAVWIGVQVQLMAANNTYDTPAEFTAISDAFSAFFLVELVLRLSAGGTGFLCDRVNFVWNYLDMFVVMLSILEFVIQQANSGSEGGGNLKNLAVLRLARAFRVFRILRVVRLMRFFRDLRVLAYSIFSTLRALVWAMVLLFLVIYIFSIVFTQAAIYHILDNTPPIESHPMLQKYWGSLMRSLFTLFKAMAGGLSWQEAADPLLDIHWVYVAFFIIYIVLVLFAVMNVVTGVFCDTAIKSTQHDQEEVIAHQIAKKSKHAQHLANLFQEIDSHRSGEITIIEFESYLQDKKVQAYFESLDINISDAWCFFKLLDTDKTMSLDLEEFVEGILRLRGPAKNIDIHNLLNHMDRNISQQEAFMSDLAAKMSNILNAIPMSSELSKARTRLRLHSRAPGDRNLVSNENNEKVSL